MTQCKNCLNNEAGNVGRCGLLEADAPAPDEKHHCLAFDETEPDGIPASYWDGTEKCPYHIAK